MLLLELIVTFIYLLLGWALLPVSSFLALYDEEDESGAPKQLAAYCVERAFMVIAWPAYMVACFIRLLDFLVSADEEHNKEQDDA